MKKLLFLALLAAAVGVVYYARVTYTDIVETETRLREETAPDGSAAPRSPAVRTTKLLDAARRADVLGNWDEADRLYRKANAIQKSDLVTEKLQAIERVRLAQESEKNGDLRKALSLYRQARPALVNTSVLPKRIKHLREHVRHDEFVERGEAAEKEGRWQEAAEAYHEARQAAAQAELPVADLLKKIQRNRARADELEKALDGYHWLFQACTALQDPYATVAASDHYLGRELFLSMFPDLGSRRREAVQSILQQQGLFPQLALTEDTTWVVVRLKNGATVRGTLVSQDDRGLTFLERDCDEYRKRLIGKPSIETLERRARPAAEANNERAEMLLAKAAKTCVERPVGALGVIGRLLYEFPDAAIMQDKRKQRTIILHASLQASRKRGSSIEELLASNVAFYGKICLICGGTGRAVCPVCKGTGEVVVQCDHCRGTGRAYCGTCGGGGERFGGGKCRDCRGTGTRPCPKCKGDCGFRTVCTKCRKGYLPTCPGCRGTGERPTGKFRPEDAIKLREAVKAR